MLPEGADLPRTLGLLDATVVVAGIIIGAGIFLVPNLIARSLPSAGLILAVWIFTGLLSFCGALAYAEMGAMMPHTGGHYVYIREAFGPLWAFLSGWTFAVVNLSGAIAWLAVAFAIYLSQFIPLAPPAAKAVAVGLIGALTVVNYRGVAGGIAVQRTFTALKVAGIGILIASAALVRQPAPLEAPLLPARFPWSHFGVAMIACLLAYDGWSNISFVAGEVRHPQRNIPLALALGLGATICIYTLANMAYLRVLPVSVIAASDAVGAAAAHRSIGRLGAELVSIIILVSIVGSSNGQFLTAPRILFAEARDGLFFRPFGRVHPRHRTPSFSVLAQGVWAAILVLTGSYQALVTYAMFAAWIFYAMAVAGVMVLRHKYPAAERPYRMWGYPVTPLLFVAIALGFVANTVVSRPGPSLAGALLIAAGVPVYYLQQRRAVPRHPLSDRK
jgi:basic amino acid/polyamine antiporter, APA family